MHKGQRTGPRRRQRNTPRLRLADEVLGLIRTARTAVDGALWIRAQRASARHVHAVSLAREDLRRRLAALDPAVDGRGPVHAVGAGAAKECSTPGIMNIRTDSAAFGSRASTLS